MAVGASATPAMNRWSVLTRPFFFSVGGNMAVRPARAGMASLGTTLLIRRATASAA